MILLIAFLIVEILAAVNVNSPYINLIAAGLALFAMHLLFPNV